MIRCHLAAGTLLAMIFWVATGAAHADEPADKPVDGRRQFTFSWAFRDGDEMAPRGGISRGADLSLVGEPTKAWQALQEEDLTPWERDRRAILAMAGRWRASFDFIETAGFEASWAPSRPYRSWGTEYVKVVTNEPNFISLQHILVMYMKTEAGEVRGPFVQKHWRQDWQYETASYHEYRGNDRWTRTRLTPAQREGAWVQTVWQVDDSPRYATVGRWHHDPGMSAWEGAPTLRPLPRREFSIRDDYDALRAVNRHIVTPTGWVHEEANDKLVLGGDMHRVLAREAGLNRYEQITDHDFSAGAEYWETTAPFWAVVRDYWKELWTAQHSFRFKSGSDAGPLFMKLFGYATELERSGAFDAEEARDWVKRTLAEHVTPRVDAHASDNL